jgi:predicted CoA-binding protein
MAARHIKILKNAKTILLIDWPDKSVPMALLKAGFMVIGYSPGKYTLISYKTSYAEDKLVFNDLEGTPGEVEIVNIFRPEEEHEEIFERHILPLKAKAVWLQPPVTSAKTAKLAKKHDLVFVKGYDIASAAAELSINN